MAFLRRREQPPAIPGLELDERIVSWADTADGDVVAVTPLGLWWPGGRRIGWQFVNKAVWRDGVLSVTEADVVDELLLVDREPVSVALSKPRDLPPTVRKRVEANIVKSELLAVPGGAVRFVARRQPGRDGVSWWAHLQEGTQDSPTVRSAVAARLAILRSD